MFNSNRDRYHAEYARRHYPVGTKIRLLAMNDPYDPVPPGTIGTVTCVDDAGQLHMDWQNGRTLALVPGTAFGDCGEGYLRVSYAYSLEDLQKAIERIKRFVARLDGKTEA